MHSPGGRKPWRGLRKSRSVLPLSQNPRASPPVVFDPVPVEVWTSIKEVVIAFPARLGWVPSVGVQVLWYSPFPAVATFLVSPNPAAPDSVPRTCFWGSPQCVGAVVYCWMSIQSLHMFLEAPAKSTSRLLGLPDSLHLSTSQDRMLLQSLPHECGQGDMRNQKTHSA